MVLKDILAISGEPGLFRFIAQGKNAIIVEHLETNKRSSAYGSSKVSSLEDIAIFTEKEDLPLARVFDLIFEKHNGGLAPDARSEGVALKRWFGEVLPEYDRDRVYVSDIKKVALWYNTLHKLSLLVKEEPDAKEEPELKEESAEESLSPEPGKPKKKTAKKK